MHRSYSEGRRQYASGEHIMSQGAGFLRRLPLGELTVAAAFFLAAFAAVSVARAAGAASLVWPANALAAALLVRMPQVRWVARAAAQLSLAGVLANVLSKHDPLQWALAMSCVNVLEIGTTTWIFRNWLTFPLPEHLLPARACGWSGIFAFAVPSLTAIAGGWIVHAEFGVPEAVASFNWWRSGAIGSCLCAPAVYLYSTKTARRLFSRRFLVENLTLSAFCFISTYLAIRFVRFPFVVMAVPLMVCAISRGLIWHGAAVRSVRNPGHRPVERRDSSRRPGFRLQRGGHQGTAVSRARGDDSAARCGRPGH